MLKGNTVCSRSYIVNYYTKWVKNSWTSSANTQLFHLFNLQSSQKFNQYETRVLEKICILPFGIWFVLQKSDKESHAICFPPPWTDWKGEFVLLRFMFFFIINQQKGTKTNIILFCGSNALSCCLSLSVCKYCVSRK